MRYKNFKNKILGDKCMSCINRSHHIKLLPKDCVRTQNTKACSCCGKNRRIVEEIKPLSRWKLIGVKHTDFTNTEAIKVK